MAKNFTSDPSEANSILAGTTITGDIECDGNLRIAGSLTGNLNCKGKLVIAPSGTIKGEVNCKNCDISGTLEGKIIVQELLSLKATAKLYGDIKNTNKISIEPGAVFTGTCNMGSTGQPLITNAPKPQQEKDKEGEKPIK